MVISLPYNNRASVSYSAGRRQQAGNKQIECRPGCLETRSGMGGNNLKYDTVIDHVIRGIRLGIDPDRSKIPSEKDLAEEIKVSVTASSSAGRGSRLASASSRTPPEPCGWTARRPPPRSRRFSGKHAVDLSTVSRHRGISANTPQPRYSRVKAT